MAAAAPPLHNSVPYGELTVGRPRHRRALEQLVATQRHLFGILNVLACVVIVLEEPGVHDHLVRAACDPRGGGGGRLVCAR